MTKKPLIPKKYLELYRSWYLIHGHSGALMILRSYLTMLPDYGAGWYKLNQESIDAKLFDLELEIDEETKDLKCGS